MKRHNQLKELVFRTLPGIGDETRPAVRSAFAKSIACRPWNWARNSLLPRQSDDFVATRANHDHVRVAATVGPYNGNASDVLPCRTFPIKE